LHQGTPGAVATVATCGVRHEGAGIAPQMLAKFFDKRVTDPAE
jgi:hypothetical protein